MRLRQTLEDEQERERTSLSNCDIIAAAVVILVTEGAAAIDNLEIFLLLFLNLSLAFILKRTVNQTVLDTWMFLNFAISKVSLEFNQRKEWNTES